MVERCLKLFKFRNVLATLGLLSASLVVAYQFENPHARQIVHAIFDINPQIVNVDEIKAESLVSNISQISELVTVKADVKTTIETEIFYDSFSIPFTGIEFPRNKKVKAIFNGYVKAGVDLSKLVANDITILRTEKLKSAQIVIPQSKITDVNIESIEILQEDKSIILNIETLNNDTRLDVQRQSLKTLIKRAKHEMKFVALKHKNILTQSNAKASQTIKNLITPFGFEVNITIKDSKEPQKPDISHF